MRSLTKPRAHKAAGGFTLIEVLVVVAIIALLVAILAPSLAQARKQARRVACGSNLHQLGIAMVAYRTHYKEFPQQAMIGIQANGTGEAFGLLPTSVHRTLARFVQTGFKKQGTDMDSTRVGDVFYCPNVRDRDRNGDLLGEDQVDQNAEPYLHITYAYYGRLNRALNDPAECSNHFYDDPPACNPKTDIPLRRRHYVINESDARDALMGDMVMFWGGGNGTQGRWRINHGPWYRPYVQDERPMFEGANLAYGDAHVEWLKPHKFPIELRGGLPKNTYKPTATLVRDTTLPDLLWW